MHFINLVDDGQPRAAVVFEAKVHWLNPRADLGELIREERDLLALGREALAQSPGFELAQAGAFAPLLPHPGKVICLGLNYYDHAKEGGREKPVYPWFFMRSSTSLVGHKQVVPLPKVSDQFDYEAEMAVVIGKRGRYVKRENALDLVLGYACFNDLSVRDYQKKTPQWTIGKNFDCTGPFGPALVLANELPEGGKGLRIQCRINDYVVQDANTSDMIFDVAETIELLTECMTLEPGDVLVMGTPAGVGFARQPPMWLKDGDRVEVEIERIGMLQNYVQREA